tara:strand:+ start:1307 stop:1900 length:594 start_codon:yes stop_codon:yes gene_type:complete
MDDNFNEKLDLDELFKEKKQTYEHKIKIYQKILARVHKKIKTTSRMRNSDKFSFFLIPEFILGIPRYDMAECTSFIIEKLSDNGFMVKYTHPNLLFISWQHYLPKYQRVEIKKKTGVALDGYGNVVIKKNRQQNKESLNSLLLKNTPEDKKSILKKKEDRNYTAISTYKPTGNLIYNTKMISSIENVTDSNKKINFK